MKSYIAGWACLIVAMCVSDPNIVIRVVWFCLSVYWFVMHFIDMWRTDCETEN